MLDEIIKFWIKKLKKPKKVYAVDMDFIAYAIAKQIAKKPVKTKGEIVCPTCRTLVGSNPYCKYCGQALDWSDT